MTRRAQGFTWVELAITLAVAGLLLALAVPGFADALDRNRVQSAAQAIASLATDARGLALKSGRDVSVALGGTPGAWCVGANIAPEPVSGQAHGAAAACDCTQPDACRVPGAEGVVRASSFPGVVLPAGQVAAYTLDGRAGHVVPLSATTLDLASPRAHYALRVQISPLGQAQVCVPDGEAPVPGTPPC